jgi:hypothetical protein
MLYFLILYFHFYPVFFSQWYIFWCSAYDGNASNDLDLGDEVEYTLARKSSKMSAENIRKLPKGTVGPAEVVIAVYFLEELVTNSVRHET